MDALQTQNILESPVEEFRVPHQVQTNISSMSKSNTIEMISSNNLVLNILILGRVNKKFTAPFVWYEIPNVTFQNDPFQHACIISSLQDEKSIECFFKMIISIEIV